MKRKIQFTCPTCDEPMTWLIRTHNQKTLVCPNRHKYEQSRLIELKEKPKHRQLTLFKET